jgi:tetratricopeptide (TPR) repeat protein
MYRHRGHRYLTLRRFADAIADLEKAAALRAGAADEIEPDGQPNARNQPLSTLHGNIHYHLGLARYLSGDFAGAARAFSDSIGVAGNHDMIVAGAYWLYLSLRRDGRADDAARVVEPIGADLEIIENQSYHQLLLVFRGDRAAGDLLAAGGEELDRATVRYGLGAWHLIEGRRAEAEELFREAVKIGMWPAFGHIAAEAELARLRAP